MKEKLIIKNFGPIKSVELDLGRFNILIGEQATGKSTVAKVLAVCRYFSYIVHTNIDSITEGLQAWGLFEFLKKESYIFYECKHYSVTIQQDIENFENNGLPGISWDFPARIEPLSLDFKNLLNELEKIKPKYSDPLDVISVLSWRIPTSFFLNDVKNVMDNPFYLPTERGLQSIFSLGQGSIPNLANFLFNYFSKVDGILKSFKTETEIEPLDILYVNRNGVGYIKKKEEKDFYLLSNAASGYQSTIPIVLVMKYYNEKLKRRKTFIIEEPELNLFPTAQDKLMQYLVDKTVNYGNTILLTTQSPYIQTSLNNMMYAYQVGQINSEKTSGIIDKKYWINPEEVSAYRLLIDGSAKNILDKELMQIDAGEIDEVSRNINDKWDKLANVEYNKTDES